MALKKPKRLNGENEKIKDNPFNEDIVKGIYKFITPEEADKLILAQLKQNQQQVDKRQKWPAELLQIRDAVIIQYMCEQGLSVYKTSLQLSDRWNIALSTARYWVTEAMHNLATFATENIEDTRKKHIERLENMLQTALDNGSSDAALKCLDQLAKVNGLYVDKKEVKVDAEDIHFDFS